MGDTDLGGIGVLLKVRGDTNLGGVGVLLKVRGDTNLGGVGDTKLGGSGVLLRGSWRHEPWRGISFLILLISPSRFLPTSGYRGNHNK